MPTKTTLPKIIQWRDACILSNARTGLSGWLCLVAFFFSIASIAHADNGQATDEAFAALLSMPTAAPESGVWNFTPPDDFQPKTERELIRWLEQKQKQGADFNAYRHFGTLLHHAIRSRLDETALWLLKHGSNPRLKIKPNSANSGQDALALALDRKRLQIADVLSKAPYQLTPPPPQSNYVRESLLQHTVKTLTPQDIASQDKIRSFIRVLHEDLIPKQYPVYTVYPNQISASLATAQSVLSRVPEAVLSQALDDDETIRQWFGWLSILPSADFNAFLQKTAPAMLASHRSAVVEGMSLHTQVDFANDGQHGKNPVDKENWKHLLERLPGTLDANTLPPLLAHTEPELWQTLFDKKYRIRDVQADLCDWLAHTPPESLQKVWPSVSASASSLKQDAIRMVFNDFIANGESGCSYKWFAVPKGTDDKVRFLLNQGANKPSLELKPQCMRYSPPAVIQELVKLGVIQPFTPPTEPIFVPDNTPHCEFNFNEAWYQALYFKPVIINEDFPVFIDAVKAIELPESKDCGLLVSGLDRVDPYIGGEQDGFTGPTEEPIPSCPDPTNEAQIWRLSPSGQIEKQPANQAASSILTAVKDTRDDHRYWLADLMGCQGLHQVSLLDWQTVDGKPSLKTLNSNHSAWLAFTKQCDPGKLEDCALFKPFLMASESDKPVSAADVHTGLSLQNFLNIFQDKEHATYLKAVENLDKPALKAIESKGIPPFWTLDAIHLVMNAKQALPEKRKRFAWLFKNHDQLAAAGLSRDDLMTLFTLLPREDWWPLLEFVYVDKYMADSAREQGKEALACDIEHALGLMCGETWSVVTQQGSNE